MAERDRVDKVDITVPAGMSAEFFDAAMDAGWSDDPGTGKAILITDPLHENYGAEILNPQPMAPPVGYVAEDTLEDMVRRHMQKQFNLMQGDEIIEEDENEVDDFDVPDDLEDLESIYNVKELVPEVPSLGSQVSDAVVAALKRQKEEEAKPPPPPDVSEEKPA